MAGGSIGGNRAFDCLLHSYLRFAADSGECGADMPAHIRSMLTQTSLSIPLVDGRLVLGTWQAIYLFEHRRRPHERTIVLHLIGE
jgi:secondary thiamine-phosphate synthase enzyme